MRGCLLYSKVWVLVEELVEELAKDLLKGVIIDGILREKDVSGGALMSTTELVEETNLQVHIVLITSLEHVVVKLVDAVSRAPFAMTGRASSIELVSTGDLEG